MFTIRQVDFVGKLSGVLCHSSTACLRVRNLKPCQFRQCPLSEKPLILKGQMGKPGFWASFEKIGGFQGKTWYFTYILYFGTSQAKCRMFEEQSKGAGSRASVERSRQVSFAAKLYIGFLDVFWESLVVSFCTAKCA